MKIIRKNLHKHLGVSFLIFFLFMLFYPMAENAFAQTSPQSDAVVVSLVVDPGITISDVANFTMDPNMGIAANGSVGSGIWTVVTNAALGYTLAVKASASPAMVHTTIPANSFADYTESVAGTPEVWNVASGDKEFGFSASGTDAGAEYGTGGCAAIVGGIPSSATRLYEGFAVTDNIIATRATVTPVAGIATTVCYAAEQDGVFAPSGTYTASITATATTL